MKNKYPEIKKSNQEFVLDNQIKENSSILDWYDENEQKQIKKTFKALAKM